MINFVSDYIKEREEKKRQNLIENYEGRMDSINLRNMQLIYQINDSKKEIDSLKKIKSKIYLKEYEKKMNVINDDNAANHAEWMDSILYEVKHSE